MKHLKVALAWALTSATFALSASAEVAQEAIDFYKMLAVAEVVDDKCNRMPFVERALLTDALIEAAHMLPPVLESTANGDDSQTYFNVLEQATKPIREDVAATVTDFPCGNAEIAFSRARLFIYVDLIAHFQKGRDFFMKTATDRHKGNFSATVDFVKQGLSKARSGTFEQMITQRMKKVEYTGEQAANRAKYMLDLIFITQLLAEKQLDIRWQADSMTWGLYSVENDAFVHGYRFEKSLIDYRFSAEGSSALLQTYTKEPVVIIPGAHDNQVTILALPTAPDIPIQNTQATIQMGSGLFGTYKSQPALDCPVDVCLEFSFSDTLALRDRLKRNNGEHTAPFYLNEINESFGSISLEDLRKQQGLSPFFGPSMFLRDNLFGD